MIVNSAIWSRRCSRSSAPLISRPVRISICNAARWLPAAAPSARMRVFTRGYPNEFSTMRPPIYLPDADLSDITISPLIVLIFLLILGAVLTLLPVLLVIATVADIVFFFSPKTKTLYEKHLQEFNDHVETNRLHSK